MRRALCVADAVVFGQNDDEWIFPSIPRSHSFHEPPPARGICRRTHAKMRPSLQPYTVTNLSWVRRALVIVASGYTVAGLLAVFMRPGIPITIVQNTATALLCWVAFFWSVRQPRPAALFAIGVIGLELAEVIFRFGRLEATVPVLFPVLVLTTGMLYGTRALVASAAVAALAILLAPMAGRYYLHRPAADSGEIYDSVIVEVELFGTVFFGWIVLSAYRRLLSETDESRQRYHQLFEHAPDGLVEVDEQSRIVEANPAALKMLGLASGPAAGRALGEVLRSAHGPDDFDLEQVRFGHLRVVEIAHGGATRFFEIAARPQPGTESRLLLVIRDTTARRMMEARQEQAQRLETVGRLAGGIAHDLNNMLTAIGGNAELLKESADPEVSGFATSILAAQRRAAHLIRQLLSFAQHDFRAPHPFDLLEEMMRWEEMLRRQAGDGCQLEIGGDEHATIVADDMQIQRILLNLVSNAREASPKGDLVALRVRRLLRSAAMAFGSPLEAERQVALEVIDYGRGMTAEVKSRLFEPFFTTKPQGEGTGLGLAAVHGLVAQNGGAVEIESTENHGTTVRIFFPESAASPSLDSAAGGG
jgi:PAS domain S-box-containing protein